MELRQQGLCAERTCCGSPPAIYRMIPIPRYQAVERPLSIVRIPIATSGYMLGARSRCIVIDGIAECHVRERYRQRDILQPVKHFQVRPDVVGAAALVISKSMTKLWEK